MLCFYLFLICIIDISGSNNVQHPYHAGMVQNMIVNYGPILENALSCTKSGLSLIVYVDQYKLKKPDRIQVSPLSRISGLCLIGLWVQ